MRLFDFRKLMRRWVVFGCMSGRVKALGGRALLAEFAVERPLFHGGVKLHLFKTAGSPDAFLITGGNVTGRIYTGGTGLGAFQNDDFTRHGKKRSKLAGRECVSVVRLVNGFLLFALFLFVFISH